MQYPKIGKYVHIYHPDMQGPMDLCEMLWGSELFIDLIDKPENFYASHAEIVAGIEADLSDAKGIPELT